MDFRLTEVDSEGQFDENRSRKYHRNDENRGRNDTNRRNDANRLLFLRLTGAEKGYKVMQICAEKMTFLTRVVFIIPGVLIDKHTRKVQGSISKFKIQ